MKKILIVGVSSLVGSHLAMALRKRYRILGSYAYNRPRLADVPCVPFVIGPNNPVHELFQTYRPEVVIYCAGMTNFEECEQNPVGNLYLNAQAPATIAQYLSIHGGRMIYLSSSKIFSGEKGNYIETDATDPQGHYGHAKKRAEELLSPFEDVFLLRLGTIYGLGGHKQNSMLNRLLSNLWDQKEMPVIHDEYRSFIPTDELSTAIEHVIQADKKQSGIYHIGNDQEKQTYHTFTQSLAEAMNLDDGKLRPITGADFNKAMGIRAGSKGSDLSLNSQKFQKAFGMQFASLESGLTRIAQQLRTGHQ